MRGTDLPRDGRESRHRCDRIARVPPERRRHCAFLSLDQRCPECHAGESQLEKVFPALSATCRIIPGQCFPPKKACPKAGLIRLCEAAGRGACLLLIGTLIGVAGRVGAERGYRAGDALANAHILQYPAALAAEGDPAGAGGNSTGAAQVGAFAEAVRVVSRAGQRRGCRRTAAG